MLLDLCRVDAAVFAPQVVHRLKQSRRSLTVLRRRNELTGLIRRGIGQVRRRWPGETTAARRQIGIVAKDESFVLLAAIPQQRRIDVASPNRARRL